MREADAVVSIMHAPVGGVREAEVFVVSASGDENWACAVIVRALDEARTRFGGDAIVVLDMAERRAYAGRRRDLESWIPHEAVSVSV